MAYQSKQGRRIVEQMEMFDPHTPKPEPFDPYCNRFAHQIPECVEQAADIGLTPGDWVKQNEGTYNYMSNHFACTECYIRIGMPANPYPQSNWVAP
jgi:hypothetical protein